MPNVEVLKFGSSVLRSPRDLHVAVDEIYRRWRSGCRVLAVVSAFEGVTDELMADVMDSVGNECPEAVAAYVATGEERTAALLQGSLHRYGLPSRLVNPREIALIAEGPLLESKPTRVDVIALERLFERYPILVLPGFYGADGQGRTSLFGRGGSDLSALFLAAALGASCRLLKDVRGVFDADPASATAAHRFSALSWTRALEVSGPLIQKKALQEALNQGLAFEVGRPNEAAGTRVGHTNDTWAPPTPPARPLRIALFGCGVVGFGVYKTIKRYPEAFEILHVVVRAPERYPHIDRLTTDAAVALDPAVDIVVVCCGGQSFAYSVILASLNSGKYVVTANKAAVASNGESLAPYTRGERRLWYSAAVGGALPALETLATLREPVREIRGIINGTCGVVLDAWSRGESREAAILHAQARGFVEADPTQDLSGRDSADKLALLIEASFSEWIRPEHICTQGIDAISDNPIGYKVIARARRSRSPEHGSPHITVSVSPERPPPGSFLGEAYGPENRLEIELDSGEIIRLRAQGAGRWPTSVSVLGDLHEIARLVEQTREVSVSQPITSHG
jgi:homoserine dehydrogenase